MCVHLPVTHPGALPGAAALPHHLVGGCWAAGGPKLLHPAAWTVSLQSRAACQSEISITSQQRTLQHSMCRAR